MAYDVVIRNGTPVDGTGAPRFRADIAIAEGRIAEIGTIKDGAKQVMTLERAVERLTTEPARFFGIQDRGRLAVGLAADIAIFDDNTIGSGRRPEMRYDLPGGGRRLVMPAQGVQYTLVNGHVLYAEQQHTGALPG